MGMRGERARRRCVHRAILAVSSVLALRALGLGDALTAVPALRSLRTIWPRHRLVLAGSAGIGEWLSGLGVVDDVIPIDGLGSAGIGSLAAATSLRDGPEVAVNLHGRGPQSHRVLQSLEPGILLGHRCPEAGHLTGPEWDPNLHEVDRWLRLTASAGGHGSAEDLRLPSPAPRLDHIVLHPGAAHGSRRWPIERWTAVAHSLIAEGCEVVVTGGPSETDLCDAIAAAVDVDVVRPGQSDLPTLARAVATAALLLSSDTGVAHLATAYATPSVTLFGPVSPALWGARIDGDLHVALWPGASSTNRPGDPEGRALDSRLAAIQVTEVLDAARGLLSRRPSSPAPSVPAGWCGLTRR